MSELALNKLSKISERYQELSIKLSQPEIMQDRNSLAKFGKEHRELESIHNAYNKYCILENQILETKELMNDPAFRELAQEDYQQQQQELEALTKELKLLLLPKDPDDDRNIFLEIRAGAGGDEASLFSAALCRMYLRFSEDMRWQSEIISQSDGTVGGYKEVILKIQGNKVYSQLKFESGVHRVQRVPQTETQGRIHTSTCTVAVLPEAEAVDEIEINESELRIDTFRASGAGGQHVNRTESAIRITHLPSNTVVECQDERSQHKNKARAMSVLKARILAKEREIQQSKIASERRSLVGTGQRHERIRTYNYPQSRITDHRINLTLYKLAEILEQGKLHFLIEPLASEYQAELLSND